MRLPKILARFNKVVTNPIQRRWAPHLAPFAMVEHVGRKSGRQYAIPVTAWVEGDRVAIVLTYGRHTDWVRNVTAAGQFGLIRKSRHFVVTEPRVIASGSPEVVAGASTVARLFEFVLVGTVHAS